MPEENTSKWRICLTRMRSSVTNAPLLTDDTTYLAGSETEKNLTLAVNLNRCLFFKFAPYLVNRFNTGIIDKSYSTPVYSEHIIYTDSGK